MKPKFDNITFKNDLIWTPAGGNEIGFIAPLAIIVHNQEAVDEKFKKDHDKAKETYDKYINPGQQFKAKGNSHIICKITRINPKTQTVSWKQINAPSHYLPASGKWAIIGMIALIHSKEIVML